MSERFRPRQRDFLIWQAPRHNAGESDAANQPDKFTDVPRGTATPVPRDIRRAQIPALWEEEDRHALAKRFGVDLYTISHDLTALRAQGVDLPSRTGRPRDPVVMELRDQVATYMDQGLGGKAIAELLGMDKLNRIYSHMKEIRSARGEERGQSKPKSEIAERKANVKSLLEAGFSPKEIHKILRVTPGIIYLDIARFRAEQGMTFTHKPGRRSKDAVLSDEQKTAREQALDALGLTQKDYEARMKEWDVYPPLKTPKSPKLPKDELTFKDREQVAAMLEPLINEYGEILLPEEQEVFDEPEEPRLGELSEMSIGEQEAQHVAQEQQAQVQRRTKGK